MTTRKPGTPHHRLIPEPQSSELKEEMINTKITTNSDANKPPIDSPTRFEFELPDGTRVEEESVLIPSNEGGDGEVVKRGRYEYLSSDGVPVQVKWIADEQGFRLEE